MTASVAYSEMFSSHPSLMSGGAEIDGSGTINPASLNPGTINPGTLNPAVLSTPSLPSAGLSTPRGVKRSRSPDSYREGGVTGEVIAVGEAPEEPVKRKRGRPPKNKTAGGSVTSTPIQQPKQLPGQLPDQLQQLQTPTQQTPLNVLTSPPVKPTPRPVIKALPTVRDHTTDQLTPEGDEYIPREVDPDGEKKVMPTGHLTGKREYKCRTFHVPNRGDKLFMLATECARVLGYRDSYLLFNKNRSLYKIIATQAEKDDLISQGLLPYSYRSRQIAIVTAKSMFRQFGSRVIVNGRRVRDDYWEMKAKKQGFTEEDPAGEKRPGAAKQRLAAQASEAAAAAAAAQQQQSQHLSHVGHAQPQVQAAPSHHEQLHFHEPPLTLDTQPQPQMVQPGIGVPTSGGQPQLPMINVPPTDERMMKEILSVPRPRQEVTGPPYRDRVQSTPQAQLLEHVQTTSDFNKSLTQQRGMRNHAFQDYWKKSPPLQPGHLQPGQPLPSPQQSSPPLLPASQPPMPQHPQLGPPPMINPQHLSLNHQQHPHGMPQQSPVRMPQNIKPEQLHSPNNGGYMPQGYYQPPPQHHQPQHANMQQHHGMMHHQGQPMYSPQHYMQQPPPQQYRPQQSPHQQQQWWSGNAP